MVVVVEDESMINMYLMYLLFNTYREVYDPKYTRYAYVYMTALKIKGSDYITSVKYNFCFSKLRSKLNMPSHIYLLVTLQVI